MNKARAASRISCRTACRSRSRRSVTPIDSNRQLTSFILVNDVKYRAGVQNVSTRFLWRVLSRVCSVYSRSPVLLDGKNAFFCPAINKDAPLRRDNDERNALKNSIGLLTALRKLTFLRAMQFLARTDRMSRPEAQLPGS